MGPSQALSIIKEAFTMGADEGTLLSDRKFGGADVLATSYTIAQGVKEMGDIDLIVCGKQTTDGDTAQVGAEMAEWLNIPHVTNVKRIVELKDKSVTVEMDMPESIETVNIAYPCLITVEKGIFEPRLPSYRLNGSPTQVERIFPPEVNDQRELWTGNSSELSEKIECKLKELKFI